MRPPQLAHTRGPAWIPNALTISRLVLTAAFVWLMSFEGLVSSWLAFATFGLAALTDWLDGWLARRWKLSTPFGIFMDPFADKVLVLSALLVFLWMNLAPVWLVLVIVAREFIVTSLRVLAESRGVSIAAIASGKQKMVSQIVAVLCVLAAQCVQVTITARTGLPWDTALRHAGPAAAAVAPLVTWLPFAALLVAMLLSVWSGAEFVWRHRRLFAAR